MSSAKEVYDHMGNYFSSLSGMCKYWGISPDLYLKRLSRGWSQKDALTKARRGVKQKTSVIRDKYGRVFTSLVDMCRFYNVSVDTYKERRQAGFPQEVCLLKYQVYTATIQDHTGREYASLKDMCIAWGISIGEYNKRFDSGVSLKEILTTPVTYDHSAKDHLGNRYVNTLEVCKAYKIDRSTFDARMRKGWSLEKSLTFPAYRGSRTAHKKAWYDFNGNMFQSFAHMCEAYNMNTTLVCGRLMHGCDLKTALTTPSRDAEKKRCETRDHLGNVYKSRKELCEAWGIPEDVFLNRINRGDTMRETLEVVFGRFKLPLVDLRNRKYESCIDLCKENSVGISKLRKLLVDGYSRGQALILLTGKE